MLNGTAGQRLNAIEIIGDNTDTCEALPSCAKQTTYRGALVIEQPRE